MKIFVDHETQRVGEGGERKRETERKRERNRQKTKQTADLDITR